MGTTICGASAFCFWRVPPVVLLLATDPDATQILQGALDQTSIEQLQLELVTNSPFAIACSHGPSWRTAGEDSRRIREAMPLFAPWAQLPVDLLVRNHRGCHSSSLVHPSLWSAELPFGSTTPLAEDIDVTTPAFTMLQLAGQVDLIHLVLLGSELCGSFSVYRSPSCIAKALQTLIDRGRLPVIDGWRPSLSNGKLTDLWMRPPLIQPTDLEAIAANSDSRRGCRKLTQAAKLINPNAASPFEVQAGLLLGLPRQYGGEGYLGLSHNEEVRLSKEAQVLTGGSRCYCDLYWDDGLDIECQSAQHHDNDGSYLSDADRSGALRLMGIDVLPITYATLKDPRRFEALSHAVAEARNLRPQAKTSKELEASALLRDKVLVDWARLADQG